MILSPDKHNEPFGPMWEGAGMRSTVSDDFTDPEINFFAKLIYTIDNPLLKGRLADLVWLKRLPRDPKYALAAIDSYQQLPLDVDMSFHDGERCWQRAISLSRMIRSAAGNHLDQIELSIIGALESATTHDKLFRLADILISNGLGKSHSTTVAAKLELQANEFDTSGDFYSSGTFYNASAKWFKYSGEDEKFIDMTVAEAETRVKEATARVSTDHPSHLIAASILEGAIQVYRSIPRVHRGRHNVDQRINNIQLRLNEYGKRSLDEMATVSLPAIDLSESIEQARDAVSGKPPGEALRAFASLYRISVQQLRESAIDSLSRSSLLASIPKAVTSHDGRVIARTPGISGHTPSEDDEAEIRVEMARSQYTPLLSIIVLALILPALDVLRLEHRLRAADFIELARLSPIVPIGREVLFGKALAQGFDRDFATTLHLLTPQIEHMVRIQLKYAGVSTTYLDPDGIETEKGLSALIDHPKTLAIFGEDLTYEIKTLFCDQLGPNLRNNIAHGLLDDQQCYTTDSVYAWWLGLKLVFHTFWNSLSVDALSEEQEQSDDDGPM